MRTRGDVAGARVDVVRDEARAGAQPGRDEVEDARVERLVPVEEDDVDRLGQIAGERLEGVAFADVDQVSEACCRQIGSRLGSLVRFELAPDEASRRRVVAKGGRQVQRRDAERGPELHDAFARVARPSMLARSRAVSGDTAM